MISLETKVFAEATIWILKSGGIMTGMEKKNVSWIFIAAADKIVGVSVNR